MIFAILLAMSYGRELVGTSSTRNSVCYSCIDSSTSYWCAEKANSSSGYCCNSGESKSEWLGSNYDNFVCSNEILPGRAANLLCPKDTSDCEDTSDFNVTSITQNNYVDTGIVYPGRTCDYRTYLNDTVSTIPNTTLSAPATPTAAIPFVFTSTEEARNISSANLTYSVTVSVEYVYYNTYLGVYKYHTDSNSYEFVTEVGENYVGNITTTMDGNTEIYVQMHPFTYLSCAQFYVYVNKTDDVESSNSDDELNIGIVVCIVAVVTICVGSLVFVGSCILYKKFWKRKLLYQQPSNPQPQPQVITGVPTEPIQTKENFHLITNNYWGNNAATISVVPKAGVLCKPPTEDENCQQRNIVTGVQYPQVIVTHIPVPQQNPDEEEN